MCTFFGHSYELIATENFLRAGRWSGDIAANLELVSELHKSLKDGIGLPGTRLLYRCQACRKLKVETIDGTWSLRQCDGLHPGRDYVADASEKQSAR